MQPKTILLACVLAPALLAACATTTKTPAPQLEPVGGLTLHLTGDKVFAFNKGGVEDISALGREQLNGLISRLRVGDYGDVRITGYTDRIGSEQVNQALSKRRAEAVRDYMTQQGIPANKIIVAGRGSQDPVVECNSEQGQALINCLAPNRRVLIQVDPPRSP